MTGQGPWGPEQYDPRQHQQRLGPPTQQGYQPPQDPPGRQQPGYGQQQPWGPQQYGPGQNQRGLQQPPAQYAPQGYGQVQPYAPPQPYQGYPQYGQPQYAPPIAPKSTAAGLILGLLWPGVGCMYAGRVGIGILLMGIWLISIPLVFVLGLGFITGFCTWVASEVLGYTMTRDWNAAHGIVSLSARARVPPQVHPDGLEEPVRHVTA
jgi:TM2 domain-containing membrane protein YozV